MTRFGYGVGDVTGKLLRCSAYRGPECRNQMETVLIHLVQTASLDRAKATAKRIARAQRLC